jgi:ADP-heptose:LPS heptosyltransferase
MTDGRRTPGEGRLVPDVERIAVLKATALGDFIQCLPALDALRSTYPSAAISLLARPWHRALLAGRPGPIDDVIVVPEGAIGDEAGGDRPDERDRFLDGLAGIRFDLAVQLHGGGRHSNPFVRRLGARVTAGPQAPGAAPLDRMIPYEVYQSDLIRSLEAVALVGASGGTLEPRLAVLDSDLAESRAALGDVGAPIAIIHPGATDTRRRWPAERFAAVADALVGAGAVVCVTGVDVERDVVAAVVRSARSELVDLSGRLSLTGLVGLLARASVVVSNDTGPRHLAAAVGTPTVSVYWVGNVITAGPLTRSRNRVAISWRVNCPACGRDCMRDPCEHGQSFVADVPIEDVLEPALELLGTPPAMAVAS